MPYARFSSYRTVVNLLKQLSIRIHPPYIEKNPWSIQIIFLHKFLCFCLLLQVFASEVVGFFCLAKPPTLVNISTAPSVITHPRSGVRVKHGLIEYTETKAKCRNLKKKLACKGTLRQVFIRVYRLEMHSDMLVF